MFTTLCTIEIDTSHLMHTSSVKMQRGLNGAFYYSMKFDVVLLVGGVELKILLAWQENVRSRWYHLSI